MKITQDHLGISSATVSPTGEAVQDGVMARAVDLDYARAPLVAGAGDAALMAAP